MPNKPTTLRESLEKEFKGKRIPANEGTGNVIIEQAFIDEILSFITSHNTELISKIEGLKIDEMMAEEVKSSVLQIINNHK